MNDRPDPASPSPHRPDRRTLAEIFGEVFPDTTADERASYDERRQHDVGGDEWYLSNRPPHHERDS